MVDRKDWAGQFPIGHSSWMSLVTDSLWGAITGLDALRSVRIICLFTEMFDAFDGCC
jgi:hypothetical protein